MKQKISKCTHSITCQVCLSVIKQKENPPIHRQVLSSSWVGLSAGSHPITVIYQNRPKGSKATEAIVLIDFFLSLHSNSVNFSYMCLIGTALDTGYTRKNPTCVQTAFHKSNLGEIHGHMGGLVLGLKNEDLVRWKWEKRVEQAQKAKEVRLRKSKEVWNNSKYGEK